MFVQSRKQSLAQRGQVLERIGWLEVRSKKFG